MTIGPDRVQVYKRESSSYGGDDTENYEYIAPVPIQANEDAIEAAGYYLQEPGKPVDETVAVYRHKDGIWVKDKHYPDGRPIEVLYESDGSLVLTTDFKYVWIE